MLMRIMDESKQQETTSQSPADHPQHLENNHQETSTPETVSREDGEKKISKDLNDASEKASVPIIIGSDGGDVSPKNKTHITITVENSHEDSSFDDADPRDEKVNQDDKDVDGQHDLSSSGEDEKSSQNCESRQSNHALSHNSNGEKDKRSAKLRRSNAVHDEESSPPPDADCVSQNIKKLSNLSISQETKDGVNSDAPVDSEKTSGKQKKLLLISGQSSSGSVDGSPCLSRDSSTELYTDSSGIDLQQFIQESLQSSKNRMFLLQVEKDLLALISDSEKTGFKFPAMNTYHRMLVHRVAAFFGMDHNVEKSTDSVFVSKTKNTRIPDFKFDDVPLKKDQSEDSLAEPKKVLKRSDDGSSSSFEKSPDGKGGKKSNRSYEERKEKYEQSRARIFASQGASSSSDGAGDCQSLNAPSEANDTTSGSAAAATANSSLISSQDDVSPGDKPWSSLESDSSSTHRVQRQQRLETQSMDLDNSHHRKASSAPHKQPSSAFLNVPNPREKLTSGKAASFGGTSHPNTLSVNQGSASTSGSSQRLLKAHSLNTPHSDSRNHYRHQQPSTSSGVTKPNWHHAHDSSNPHAHNTSSFPHRVSRENSATSSSSASHQSTGRQTQHMTQRRPHNSFHQSQGSHPGTQWSDRPPKFLLYNPNFNATYPMKDHQLANYPQEHPQHMILHHFANHLLQSGDQQQQQPMPNIVYATPVPQVPHPIPHQAAGGVKMADQIPPHQMSVNGVVGQTGVPQVPSGQMIRGPSHVLPGGPGANGHMSYFQPTVSSQGSVQMQSGQSGPNTLPPDIRFFYPQFPVSHGPATAHHFAPNFMVMGPNPPGVRHPNINHIQGPPMMSVHPVHMGQSPPVTFMQQQQPTPQNVPQHHPQTHSGPPNNNSSLASNGGQALLPLPYAFGPNGAGHPHMMHPVGSVHPYQPNQIQGTTQVPGSLVSGQNMSLQQQQAFQMMKGSSVEQSPPPHPHPHMTTPVTRGSPQTSGPSPNYYGGYTLCTPSQPNVLPPATSPQGMMMSQFQNIGTNSHQPMRPRLPAGIGGRSNHMR